MKAAVQKPLTQEEVLGIRKDFPMLRNVRAMQGLRFCYLDNGATSFKPDAVIKAIESYYTHWTANTHRGDYDLAHEADKKYAEARREVASFINADPDELVFTAGDSMGLNMVAFGLMGMVNPGDEILLSDAEHASNVLPWFAMAKLSGAVVKYIPLDERGNVTVANLKKTLSAKTKIISLAHVTNVLGNTINAKALAQVAHETGALFVLDGAQSVPHMPVDVKDLDCDFLVFSGHKMCGPTGIGCMYGKHQLLEKMQPMLSGGGMNARFNECGEITYERPPFKFEAGTQNIAGAYGLAQACRYLKTIGMDRINSWERYLRARVLKSIAGLKDVIVYNPASDTGIIDFNVKGVFAQDEATLLNSRGICVRSGQHCAKILSSFLKTDATVRASLYFYNDEQDADQFAAALTKGGDFLDAYFA